MKFCSTFVVVAMAMACIISKITFAAYFGDDINPSDYYTCPSLCSSDPCPCDEAGKCVAETCSHANGCDQCQDGYFKKDYNYSCVSCTETFGDECLHCTDFLGCQQCDSGYTRYYDDECDLYFCIEDGSVFDGNGTLFEGCPVECDQDPCSCSEVQNCLTGTCHSNGCDQCIDNHFKKDYNYHCVDCQEYGGDACLHCTDFLGCQQCEDDGEHDLEYDDECGLYFCNGPFCEESVTVTVCTREDETCIIDCSYLTDLTFEYDNNAALVNGFPILTSESGDDIMYVNSDGYLTIEIGDSGRDSDCIYYSVVEVGDYDGSNDPFNNDVSWTQCGEDPGVDDCDISISYEDCGQTFNPGDFCTSDCIEVYSAGLKSGDPNDAGVSVDILSALVGEFCYDEEDGGGGIGSPPAPTDSPTDRPTNDPTPRPTERPTSDPTPYPTPKPTRRPTPNPTNDPTDRPTDSPSNDPTSRPTDNPTPRPTDGPSPRPTARPTNDPTPMPSDRPTDSPTNNPTGRPSPRPTWDPTPKPTRNPSPIPTISPTNIPSDRPTDSPTDKPSLSPTDKPSLAPTDKPSLAPTDRPSLAPTDKPTESPSPRPTSRPTPDPTSDPTPRPSPRPTNDPTSDPTGRPTPRPTDTPTGNPTDRPSTSPTDRPTDSPVDSPSGGSCETAFAYFGDDNDADMDGFGSYCFLDDGFSRWGWGMRDVDGSGFDIECGGMYAGAAKCDTNKGTYVGSFCIMVASDGTYTAIYDNNEGAYTFEEYHFYIGTDDYPQSNGADTVAPGQYTHVVDGLSGSTGYVFTGTLDTTQSYTIIAHAVSCGEFEDDRRRRLQASSSDSDHPYYVNTQGDIISQFTVNDANEVILEIYEEGTLSYSGIFVDNADDLCDGNDYFANGVEVTLVSEADGESETTIVMNMEYENCEGFDQEECGYPFCTDECDGDFGADTANMSFNTFINGCFVAMALVATMIGAQF